jgi:hypothetical protein
MAWLVTKYFTITRKNFNILSIKEFMVCCLVKHSDNFTFTLPVLKSNNMTD